MLLKFSVENFSSIGQKQTINLFTGKSRGKYEHILSIGKKRALKFSSIYGANGAGKSNFIKAIHFGKKIIVNGSFNKLYMKPNKSKNEWLVKPTEFIYTLGINNKIYEYGIKVSYNDETIIKEWLLEKTSREDKSIFIRDFINNDFDISLKGNKDTSDRLGIYFDDTKNENNTLFLKEINFKKGNLFVTDTSLEVLKNVYDWFIDKLKFVYPDDRSDLGEYGFLNYEKNNEKTCEYLQKLDINIDKLSYVELAPEQAFKNIPQKIIDSMQNDFKEIFRQEKEKEKIGVFARINDDYYIIEASSEGIERVKTMELTHKKGGTFSFKEESDGTKRMLELIEMLTSPEDGITYVVDEIDRSLHPLLTQGFIGLYLDPDVENNNQLIITTHESRLLNLDRLRKDEINFATNNDGETKLYRLDEYNLKKTRSDMNIEMAYLNGRYNGIPQIINYWGE